MIVEDVDGDLSLRVGRALVELVTCETGATDPVDVCLILENLTVKTVARLERLAREEHQLAVALLRKSLERHLQGQIAKNLLHHSNIQ